MSRITPGYAQAHATWELMVKAVESLEQAPNVQPQFAENTDEVRKVGYMAPTT
jgi:hypothetical protein